MYDYIVYGITLVPSSAMQVQAASLTAWFDAWLWDM